jgi:hypothetical protein
MTLTIELLNSNALKSLKDLEFQHLIRIVKKPDLTSYELPGEPMSVWKNLKIGSNMPKIPQK